MQHHFDTLMYCMCVGFALSVSVVNAYRLLFDLRVYGASILQLHCTESDGVVGKGIKAIQNGWTV